jgi:hypothetical protein
VSDNQQKAREASGRRDLVAMRDLRQEMQERLQGALNDLDRLQDVEEVFREMSDKHQLSA